MGHLNLVINYKSLNFYNFIIYTALIDAKGSTVMLKLYDLSIDYINNPSLVNTEGLRFGWKLESSNTDVYQKSFRVKISDAKGTVFDSGTVESNKCYDVSFENLILPSRSDFSVSVSVTDNYGENAESKTDVSTGILPEEWGNAEWIKPSTHLSGWAPYMRTKFTCGKVKKAVMYASGLGCAEYYVNGRKTDDYYIDPPMTNYEKTVFYRRYDITDMLNEGGNAVCVLLGEGFYSQSRVWGHYGLVYGDVCAKIRIEIELADGNVKNIVTDTNNWKYKYSPITVNNLYGGETYDCRLETDKFSEYDGSDDGWGSVIVDQTPKGILTPCIMPPVKAIRELPAISVTPCSGQNDGAWIFDIGENMAGIAEFHLPWSPKGAVYVFRYAETLNQNGDLDFRSIGTFATQCIQQDIYICRGDKGGETYRPRFCYHGYRFVEVTGIHDFSKGYGTMPQASLVKGIQLSTDFDGKSSFSTSYTYLDKIHKVMDNTYRSNFHGFPEDCPAREKCGWLGDAEVVCNWGLLNYNTVAAYEKYLNDIRTTTEVYGTWQMISPGKRGCGEASPLWGCAQIILPYYMYKYCGDREAVIKNFDLMRKWVEHEYNRSEDYIISVGLGDWDPPESNEGKRRMPVPHSSTFMFYEICVLMEELCKEFGMGDPDYYSSLAAKIKESAIRHFYNSETHSYGYWGSDGVALKTGLYPDGEKQALLDSLIKMMKNDDYAMPTGIYANKYLVPALLEEGKGDIAMEFLFNKNHPSFATMLDDNATTMWEEPDMSFITDKSRGVASYNHPMHGGFLYTLITHFAGVRPLCAAFEKFEFNPCHVSGVDDIDASFNTPAGRISVSFKKTAGGYEYTLTVPPTTSCTVNLGSASDIVIDGKACQNLTKLGSGVHSITAK